MLKSSISPNCRDWSIIICSRITSNSFDNYKQDSFRVEKREVCIQLRHSIISFVLPLEFKGGGNTISKLIQRIAVAQEYSIFEQI